jgi:hypothetical protein
VQSVASIYGFTFAECNPTSDFDPKARTHAVVGAKVADVAAQVEAQVAAGGFRADDLALVLAGTNDVLELYSQYPLRPEASLLEDARERGRRMAQVVNRLVDLGAKVIVSNLPDMGLSPYAATEAKANTDIDRAAMISRITAAFNEQLGANVLLDGRFVGLMQTDLRIQAANRSPGSFGLANATEAVCTVALPNCTTPPWSPAPPPSSTCGPMPPGWPRAARTCWPRWPWSARSATRSEQPARPETRFRRRAEGACAGPPRSWSPGWWRPAPASAHWPARWAIRPAPGHRPATAPRPA